MTEEFCALARTLERRDVLSGEEQQLLSQLPARKRRFAAGEELVAEHAEPSESCLILSGFVARAQFLADGSRQLTAIHLPGDFVDLHALLLKVMDHSVVALTSCEAAFVPHNSLVAVIEASPHVGRLLWLSTVIDGAIERACVTSLGRRAAAKHLAHLISELLLRLETVGLTRGNSFDFPLKQADVADLIGLSLVHTNRTIQELRSQGLIRWDGRVMTITDLAQLHKYAEFDPTYLNLVKRPR